MFNYIPPEEILGERGGPGTDIYALGICFYEALSGKTAYPCSLSNSPSPSVLLQRAQFRMSPVFDSPIVVSRPKLLQLLKAMTDGDSKNRVRDAAEVERRIDELVDDELHRGEVVPKVGMGG